MSKYRAKPTVVDGIWFASQKEAKRYGELKLLEKAGRIGGLLLQPKFELVVTVATIEEKLRATAARMRGNRYVASTRKIGTYRADFAYWEPPVGCDGSQRVVEDVKGFKTPLYRWKKKHVEAQYGITVVEL